MSRKNSGRMIETAEGKTGVWYNADELVEGKVPAYVLDASPQLTLFDLPDLTRKGFTANVNVKRVLLDPKSITIIGYID